MRKSTATILGVLSVLTVMIYSCTEDTLFQPTSTIDEVEVARLITYPKGEVIPGQYIVVFKENAVLPSTRAITPDNYEEQLRNVKLTSASILEENRILSKEFSQAYVKTIQGVAVALNDDEVAKLRTDERVAYIEQDQTISVTMGGPPGGGGGGGGSPAQSTPWGITRVGGSADGTNAGTAWVIDSGIDLDHEDLNVDAGRSRTYIGGNSTPDDQNGHGTHVAGTIAAKDNAVGVIGVAAGATVVSVRVLNRKGSGSNSGVIAGVDYVGANAASGDVANMSLGGGISTALDNAVVNASSACPFVLAAGNESTHANSSSPARANGPNIYTVSSMTSTDNWSYFSNYGNPPVDYCAPGSSILSCYKSGGYATLSGTSMAAPHVAGIRLLGNISTDGTVSGDPDGNADDIAHR